MTRKTGRKRPYTEIGIRRIPCTRCGKPAECQWQACANDNRYLGICVDCDIQLNAVVLEFMRLPDRKRLLDRYVKRMRG